MSKNIKLVYTKVGLSQSSWLLLGVSFAHALILLGLVQIEGQAVRGTSQKVVKVALLDAENIVIPRSKSRVVSLQPQPIKQVQDKMHASTRIAHNALSGLKSNPSKHVVHENSTDTQVEVVSKVAAITTSPSVSGIIFPDPMQENMRDVQERALHAYMLILRSKIERYKPDGQADGGTVYVRFDLLTSGELLSADVVHSSGDVELDRLALSAIRRAAPFPPAPKDIGQEKLCFTLPFNFH